MVTLEICKPCRGTGYNGTAGNTRLICHACDGIGHVFYDRASVFEGVFTTKAGNNG